MMPISPPPSRYRHRRATSPRFTCLFATGGHDLRALLRGAASDEDISDAISRVWQYRVDRYSEIRSMETVKLPKVEMSYVGG
jgi:cyclic pyranopterin phosphate synthase